MSSLLSRHGTVFSRQNARHGDCRRLENSLKEGAWINISNRQWCWITEHVDWIQTRENAQKIGLADEVWRRISLISNDYGGPKRESVLKTVMDAGFIRMRGYGDSFSFEFTCCFLTAFEACGSFLEKNAGPATVCRFHDLARWREICTHYEDLRQLMLGDVHQLLGSAIPLREEGAGYSKELFSETEPG